MGHGRKSNRPELTFAALLIGCAERRGEKKQPTVIARQFLRVALVWNGQQGDSMHRGLQERGDFHLPVLDFPTQYHRWGTASVLYPPKQCSNETTAIRVSGTLPSLGRCASSGLAVAMVGLVGFAPERGFSALCLLGVVRG